MSTQNSNTLPKIWQVVEMVHHISLLSEPSATIALACTCKLLYNSITSYNSFWHKLYQQKFPRDINTAIDWSEWQLEQEQKVETTETDAKNELESKLTWFQRYNQRIGMCLNWQKNKPTSTVHMEPFDINIIRQLVYPKESIIASYPGWIAIAIHKDLQVDLLKLSPKNMVNIHSLDLDKNYLESIRFIGFYQHQQQANDIDDGMRVIIHLYYKETPLKVLQVWNANNCQLLQFVDFNAYWNGRIICMSSLLFNFEDSENVQLFYNSFLKTELREYQYFNVPDTGYGRRFKIHKAENNEIVLSQYYSYENKILYKITRVPLTPDADLMVTDHGTAQITTIISDSFTIPDSRFLEWIDFYSIDSDRILFYCKHRVFDCNRAHWKRYIKVISLSKGVILECNYQANEHEKPVLIPQYNLVAFCSGSRSELVIISLMDGKIQHYIDISKIYNTCCYFQHIIDTKIIGYYYNTNQYCIIDANTGDVNIHTFPIPEVCYCTVSFGHMILMSKETTLIISFVPELN